MLSNEAKLQGYETRLYLLMNKGIENNKTIINKLQRRIKNLKNRIDK